MTTKTQLYRHFDKDGNLLYVGISLSAVHRLSQHRDNPWFDQIANITVRTYQHRKVAVRAEAAAIRREKPRYNVHHTKPKASNDQLDIFDELAECRRTGKYKHIQKVTGRNGKVRLYFRWPGEKSSPIPFEIGTAEFHSHYMKNMLRVDTRMTEIWRLCDLDAANPTVLPDGTVQVLFIPRAA